MEEAVKLRESATDVQEALGEIEGYLQRLKDLTIEVHPFQWMLFKHFTNSEIFVSAHVISRLQITK